MGRQNRVHWFQSDTPKSAALDRGPEPTMSTTNFQGHPDVCQAGPLLLLLSFLQFVSLHGACDCSAFNP